jgi:hypothetical protein
VRPGAVVGIIGRNGAGKSWPGRDAADASATGLRAPVTTPRALTGRSALRRPEEQLDRGDVGATVAAALRRVERGEGR